MSRFRTALSISAVVLALAIGATSIMTPDIYSSVLWKTFWLLILLSLTYAILKTKLWRNPPVFLLHISFVCMISGGFLTSLFCIRGTLHLHPGQPTCEFVTDDNTPHSLPAAMTLLEFNTLYHHGMQTPKDFRSRIYVSTGDTISISMNHIGRIKGYRLYQTSFDNEGGTILTVAHDPVGMTVVYIGFALFSLAGAWLICRRMKISLRPVVAGLLLTGISGLTPQIHAIPAIAGSMTDSIARLQVVYNGEVVPFSTVATRLTYKLTGRSDVGGLSPEVFIASLMIYKDEWCKVPFIKIKSKPLRTILHVEGDYVSVNGLYDADKNYLPGMLYKGGDGPYDRDIVALDEKVGLLMDLWKGELFVPVSSTTAAARPDFSINSEILYNRMVPVRILFILSVSLAFLSFLLAIIRRDIRLSPAVIMLCVMGWGSFLWHWYISVHFPLSASYEMMEFAGITVTTIAVLISRRRGSSLLTGLALLGAALLFLVAWIGVRDPVMSPIMPVLASPWLSVHVSLVMIGYAILGLTFPISVCALILPKERERFSLMIKKLLIPGTYMLGLGIIAGAMWANVSWGRYWAWDPKETWALVTLMLYSIPLHKSFVTRGSHAIWHLYFIFIFSSIIMTYYGVNYLPSLHAYK